MAGELRLTAEGDLYLDAAGTLAQVDGAAAIAQQCATRLRFGLGEYFGDLRQGIPYFEEILVKGGDLGRAREIVRRALLTVPGVVDVPVIELALERASRRLTVTWQARVSVAGVDPTQYGELIV